MIKFKPYVFLIYGITLYLFLFLFGPYNYTIYSISGVLYFALAFILFIFSAWLVDRPLTKNKPIANEYSIMISKKAEMFLNCVIIFSYIAFVVYITYILLLPITDGYKFAGGDYRDILSENRPIGNKIAEVMMFLGTAAYLIIARIRKLNYKVTFFLATGALFLPAIAVLSIGARSRVITSVMLFLIIIGLNKRDGISHFRTKMARGLLVGISLLAIGTVLWFTFYLFTTRSGVETAITHYLIKPGDITLKPLYYELYRITDGAIEPLYKAINYFTHSMPTFTWAFEHYKDIPAHWGANLFYLEGYFLRLVGIPFPEYKVIASQSPVAGLYSTFITGYFLDWGLVGTLIMIVLSGILFGRISYYYRQKRFSYFILPIILFMCWVAPIYYFWHMGWESVLPLFTIIYPISRFLGLKRVKQH